MSTPSRPPEIRRLAYPGGGINRRRSVLNAFSNIMLQAEVWRLPAEPIRARAMALLQRTGLDDFARKLPHELPGGQRQRAAICRASVHEPPTLFFDEPFGALDALTRQQMRIDLEKLWLERKPTVLFITHSDPAAMQKTHEVSAHLDRISCHQLPPVAVAGLGDEQGGAALAATSLDVACEILRSRDASVAASFTGRYVNVSLRTRRSENFERAVLAFLQTIVRAKGTR